MKFYKNVDIVDLNSIFEKGILSLDESGNDNWTLGKRAKNATDVVYLFQSLTKQNSFFKYGAALLEMDLSENEVFESEIRERDVNKGKYKEFLIKKVLPEQITAVYIPRIFKDRIFQELSRHGDEQLSDDVLKKVNWCEFSADHYVGHIPNLNLKPCTEVELLNFAETAFNLTDAKYMNFFRGVQENGEIDDLYNVEYIF